ncbi:MAG: transglycosylase domain-containing protein [Anaerolineales bacterium]
MSYPHLVRVVQLVKTRRARWAARRKTKAQRALLTGVIVLAAFSIPTALVAIAASPAYAYVTYDLPAVTELETLLDPQTGLLLQPTRFYDRSGQAILLALEYPEAPRRFIKAAKNEWLMAAFIASSQPDFWDSPGVRWSLSAPQTIAEGLVARVLLADEADGWLKTLRTRLLAAAAIEEYGREQVLEWALNSTSFGYWTFGPESAAQFYFAKSSADLNLAEVAMLAAVARAPALNPIDAPELTVEFQRLVLVSMREQGLIDDAQFATALAEPITVRSNPPTLQSPHIEFSTLALSQLETQLGRERVQLGGLEVITTLDAATQGGVLDASGEFEAIVLDPRNGQILALSGDPGSLREAGSATAPFVYLNAFAQSKSPASLIWDLPSEGNLLATSNHGPVSMREAMASNYEGPLAQLRSDARAEMTLQAFGLKTREVSLVDLAMAYSVLANQGTLAAQHLGDDPSAASILFAGNLEGEVLLNWTNPVQQAITSPEPSFLVNDILGDTSARSADSIDLVQPGAFFTPADSHWAIAYSPQRVMVAWGAAENAGEALPALFQSAHQGLNLLPFEIPSNLTSAIVCVPSGGLPDEACPETRREFFISGNEPRFVEPLFDRVAINSLNGLLATVFTPAEFVEERLFLRVPPQAMDWAKSANVALTPTEFDPVPILDSSQTPIITNPKPFNEASGVVNIFGRMGPADIRYEIQVGRGLYPREWTLVAEGEARSGLLARWETINLNGVYSIQLQVLYADGTLERAYTIVTIAE